MRRKPAQPRAIIEAWRTQHADAQPWRFHLIDALERRAAKHTGATREWLDARLRQLMDRYAEDIGAPTDTTAEPANGAAAPTPPQSPLAELLDRLTEHAQRQAEPDGPGDDPATASALTDLPALDSFRQTWSRLHAQSRLQQVREQPPAHGGPLSSAILVHRSMMLMRNLSPDYLAHFLAYIDDLSWLEQLAGNAASTPGATRSGSARKRTRSSSRSASVDQRPESHE